LSHQRQSMLKRYRGNLQIVRANNVTGCLQLGA